MPRVLDVRTNFADLLQQIGDFRTNRLPQTMSAALNQSIRAAKMAVRDEMYRVFDRPTPYTINAVQDHWSTKNSLVAWLTLKDAGAGEDAAPGSVNKGTAARAYLKPQIEGGSRHAKRLEQALRRSGLLPAGMFAVPSRECPLDAYGNVPKGLIVRMLSDLRAFHPDAGKNRAPGRRKGTRTTNAFFVPRKGSHLKPGIYWRLPNRMLVQIFVFTAAPRYRARFDFYGMSERFAVAAFRQEFPRQWAKTLAFNRNRPLKLAA